MKINKFYLLKVWFISLFLIALVCACWPDLRVYPRRMGFESLEFRAGMFAGVIVFELEYSVAIFICLYLLFYFLTAKFYLSEIVVKSVLFILFLVGVCIVNYSDFPGTWLHPFYIAYSLITASAFYLFDVYRFDWRYYR